MNNRRKYIIQKSIFLKKKLGLFYQISTKFKPKKLLNYFINSNVYSKLLNFINHHSLNHKNLVEVTDKKNEEKNNNDNDIAQSETFIYDKDDLCHSDKKKEYSPNYVLSQFFMIKGDNPLNEVEIEGIFSLLAKSSIKQTFEEQITNQDKHLLSTNINIDSINQNFSKDNVNMLNVKNNQHIQNKDLKFNNIISSTPSSNIACNFTYPEKESKDILSVKKKYRFSSLPSPYKSKLVTNYCNNTKLDLDFDVKAPNNSIINDKNSFKTESALTLMSLLKENDNCIFDDNNYADQSLSFYTKVKNYSNPYSSISTKKNFRKNNSHVKQQVVIAEDIDKTLLFKESLHQLNKSNNSKPNIDSLNSNENYINEKKKENTDSIISHNNKIFNDIILKNEKKNDNLKKNFMDNIFFNNSQNCLIDLNLNKSDQQINKKLAIEKSFFFPEIELIKFFFNLKLLDNNKKKFEFL